jgi:hypothetical protein
MDNWFMPQSIMVLPPQIKSVLKCMGLGTTVNGGNIVKRQGQQEPILAAGVRAIASTIRLANLLSQLQLQQ